MREIKIGSIYKHFKDKYYVVLDIVNDCEEEKRKIIIYKALYGEYLTWARPYEMFASEVDHNKYPEILQKYRFEEIEKDDLKYKELKEYINNYNKELNNKINNLT